MELERLTLLPQPGTVENLAPGIWFFVVTASGPTALESLQSNVVGGTVNADGTFEEFGAPTAPSRIAFRHPSVID